MTKRKSSAPKSRRAESAAFEPNRHGSQSQTAPLRSHIPSHAAIRETIESIIVAFVLAFLFRTFEAEAFVIPTGSMAPTLMGKHKDLDCPECKCPYQVSASDNEQASPPTEANVLDAICPMCRCPADLRRGHISYNGDRILVSKFCYQFTEPRRWDVIVFHYPEKATLNFIKRLVGLPGETIRISHGALWIRRDKEQKTEFEIARKPPEKLLAMLQPVFDNDYMPAIKKFGWPDRWRGGDWTSPDGASFQTDGKKPSEDWLRYEHLVPSPEQWGEVFEAWSKPGRAPHLRPSLISDFVAYDSGFEPDKSRGQPNSDRFGIHWVGDLALQFTLDSQSDDGETVFELVKGGRRFRCRIDLATGQAALSISGPEAEQFHPKAHTVVRGGGSHRICFANADDQLLLWIDGSVVAFDAPTTYYSRQLEDCFPQEADLRPAGIASRGAVLKISHLKLLRNIYYIATSRGPGGSPIKDFTTDNPNNFPNLAEPSTWQAFHNVRSVDFRLGADQFFVLGDNSAQSKDGRLWDSQYWVDRKLLIGKALFIYWPHSWDEVTIAGKDIPLPYFPNFKKMGFVR